MDLSPPLATSENAAVLNASSHSPCSRERSVPSRNCSDMAAFRASGVPPLEVAPIHSPTGRRDQNLMPCTYSVSWYQHPAKLCAGRL